MHHGRRLDQGTWTAGGLIQQALNQFRSTASSSSKPTPRSSYEGLGPNPDPHRRPRPDPHRRPRRPDPHRTSKASGRSGLRHGRRTQPQHLRQRMTLLLWTTRRRQTTRGISTLASCCFATRQPHVPLGAPTSHSFRGGARRMTRYGVQRRELVLMSGNGRTAAPGRAARLRTLVLDSRVFACGYFFYEYRHRRPLNASNVIAVHHNWYAPCHAPCHTPCYAPCYALCYAGPTFSAERNPQS